MEEVLSQNKDVRREAGVVRRLERPWSKSVQAFARHLEQWSLPVERPLGIEGGYEQWEFSAGELVHPRKWTDDALAAVGQLTARLHAAGREFRPETEVCQPWCLREIGSSERIWCHGDLAPWNLLTERELPVRLVDWEFAGPLDPRVELARICWLFPQLHDDDLQRMHELPSPEKRAAQVRLLCDGYGLTRAQRKGFVEQILEVMICETAHEAIDPPVGMESQGPLWGFAWRTRGIYWVWRHRSILERAMV